MLREDTGGPSPSTPLRALLIELCATAVALHPRPMTSVTSHGSSSCSFPLSVQGSCPHVRPSAGARRWASRGGLSSGWSCHWRMGLGCGTLGSLPRVQGHTDAGGQGRLPSATVSLNRKGWFCRNRHLSRRQSPGSLTGRLTLLGTRARASTTSNSMKGAC